MKHSLLILHKLNPDYLARISQNYRVLYAPDRPTRDKIIQEQGESIEAVATIGTTGLSSDEIARMPHLGFIAALGVGYEGIDLEAARERNIVLVNGAGSNSAAVADHAFALLLAQIRQICPLNELVRRADFEMPSQASMDGVNGKRLGIFGLGDIGEQIARRAVGFDMPIGYHNRSVRPNSPYRYFDSLEKLAQWSDCLVVAVPGGKATYHLVNADILKALGPRGYLVNIARGSVVDTAALAGTLGSKGIRGAALDVYEGEPKAPQELAHLDNVILTPHIAAWSPEAMERMLHLFLENLRRHFAGEKVLTPIP